jgi:hypothetical protein
LLSLVVAVAAFTLVAVAVALVVLYLVIPQLYRLRVMS